MVESFNKNESAAKYAAARMKVEEKVREEYAEQLKQAKTDDESVDRASTDPESDVSEVEKLIQQEVERRMQQGQPRRRGWFGGFRRLLGN